jgi:hypothetical protein
MRLCGCGGATRSGARGRRRADRSRPISFPPRIGRVLESEQVLTPLTQMGIRLWPGVGDGRCMFGARVICETSVSMGRLVGRLGARPSQPAAAARAGWHGPLGDLCWSSPSSWPFPAGAPPRHPRPRGPWDTSGQAPGPKTFALN